MRQPYTFTKSKEIWTRAQLLIANGAEQTRQLEYDEQPIFFERAKGCRMWDVDGNEFIDLLCSIGPITLGYAYARVGRRFIEGVNGIVKNQGFPARHIFDFAWEIRPQKQERTELC